MRRWWWAGGVALVALAVPVAVREGHWRGTLYCIERPGQLWGGAFGPVPEGAVPECPQTASYRGEVRRGESKVEQYRLSGWQPTRLKDLLVRRGVAVLEAEFVNAGVYEAFVQAGPGKVYVLAERTRSGTLLTLIGRP